MSEVDALFWALKAAYGGNCLEDDHGLTFTGPGFVAHLSREGQVSLAVADGSPSPVQGWLMSALAEFLAPAHAQRDAGGGVAVPLGRHILHFRSDGTMKVSSVPAGRVAGGPDSAAGAAPNGRAGAAMAPVIGRLVWRADDTARRRTEGQALPPGWPTPTTTPPTPTLSEEIAELAAAWPRSTTATPEDIAAARAQVRRLLQRVRQEELPGGLVGRRAALRTLARVDSTLGAVARLDTPRRAPEQEAPGPDS